MEVGDEAALVADGEVDVDEVDVDLEGLGVADVDGLGLGLAGGGRAAGGGCLLRVEDGGETRAARARRRDRRERIRSLDDEVGGESWEKCGRCGWEAGDVTLGGGAASKR